MKFAELKKNLNTKIENVYLIVGADAFLKKSALQQIEKKVLSSNAELNSVYFSTDNLDENKVIDACNTMPFFAERKLVVIKEFEKKNADNLISKLKVYLSNVNNTTCLVLVAEENSNYFNELKNSVEVIDCNYLSKGMLKSWVLNQLKNVNFEIEPMALENLIEYCNYNLSRIDLELKKLLALKMQEKNITLNDIENNIHKDLEFQIYELTNALSLKNSDTAYTILNILFENKYTYSAIFSTIYRHFRRLFYISITKQTNTELAQKLEVKEYAIIKASQQVKHFKVTQLKKIIELINQLDYKAKTGKIDGEKALNYLILTILNL